MSDKHDFPGSRWYKFDFHIHTPASDDYKEPNISPENWLKHAMESNLDCVAITDHNSGEWIDRLKNKNDDLKTSLNKPEWYRDLTIFPGFEITIGESYQRVHLLALFDPSLNLQEITSILGACGILNEFGNSDVSTIKSFADTVSEITNAGGIAIPAHIDQTKGLLENHNSLNREIKKSLEVVHALEVCEINDFTNRMEPQLQTAVKILAKVRGSDAHNPSDIGRHFTWIKMSRPTIEGLKLALGDHEFCTKNVNEDPNIFPEVFLTELTIQNMIHCGRILGKPLKIQLHPQFNSIIGGRGTGKSTIIESIRIVSRQDINLANEAPNTKLELNKFMGLSQNNGVILNDTEIQLQRQRRGKDYRIRWRQDGEGPILEGKSNGDWKEFEVGDLNDRFPISVFSQKQINELATNTQGLLGLIDRSTQVNRASWNINWEKTKSRFFQMRERRRELLKSLANESQIKAKLGDVEYDLKQYEEKGHGVVLKEYQKRNQQKNGLTVDPTLVNLENRIMELSSLAELNDFPEHLFDDLDDTTEEMKNIHLDTSKRINIIGSSLIKLAEEVRNIREQRINKIRKSRFYSALNKSEEKYNQLINEYETKKSPFSISLYGEWVNERSRLQLELESLESIKSEIQSINDQIKNILDELLILRKDLFQKRKQFLGEVIGDNKFVQMELIPFGDVSKLESDYREILNLETGKFSSSILDPENNYGILLELYNWEKKNIPESKIEELISSLKTKTFEIATGDETGNDRRFDTRLKKYFETQPSKFDELDIWWPEDMLRVKYSKNSSSKKFENLEKGSAGQKAAAILAFLLSYGKEPLIIDQPEDDLDNALIYDLIVQGIQDTKNNRQLIIATHNPNIVVNGDTELVNVLKFDNGQVQLDKQGGLEESNITEAICNIMEGGRQAFEKRYKRITLKI